MHGWAIAFAGALFGSAMTMTLTYPLMPLATRPCSACTSTATNEPVALKPAEFAPTARYVAEQTRLFTGRALFDSNGTAHREQSLGRRQYVGTSDEVDTNWDELIRDRFFYISVDEYNAHWPTDSGQYDHDALGYPVSLEVFHTLHCLNHVRHELKHRSDAQYSADASAHGAFSSYHTDHCLDAIRQAVQCSADLTPLPVRLWPEERGIGIQRFVDSDQLHTCRDFNRLRAFLDDRKKLDDDKKKQFRQENGIDFDWGEWSKGPVSISAVGSNEIWYEPVADHPLYGPSIRHPT